MRPSTLAAPLCVALAVAAAPLHAQDVVLDQGSYVLTRNGEEVGTESFTLRRVGAGAEARIWATATVEQDRGSEQLSMRPVLQTAADRTPLGYQNEVTGGESTEVQIGMVESRFVAMIRSPRGERERELRAAQGAVFLEGTVVHQYYFLPPAPESGSVTVPVIVPRTGEQHRATLARVGTEELRIAGRAVQTVRSVLTVADEERHVWRDDDGHVIRLEIPGRSFAAERIEL